MNTSTPGWIAELFAGIQGEGSWAGRRQLFLRLAGCGLSCGYCDTRWARAPHPRQALLRDPDRPHAVPARLPNPIAPEALAAITDHWCARFGPFHSLAITGGEPLEQPEFVRGFLTCLRRRRSGLKILLETNGVSESALRRIRSAVDFIAADLKLPSAAGCRPTWAASRRFLTAARGTDGCVKAVFSTATPLPEIRMAARLARECVPAWDFILQPVTPRLGFPAGAEAGFQTVLRAALAIHPGSRFLPQIHPLLGIH